MIELQIMKKLPRLSSQYPLQDILEREKCLIILDGLDEWIHPDNGCSDQNEKVPHRYARDNCVILTTTRPWKLGVSNLKTSEVNKKIELVQLNDDSTYQLQKNAIRKMSGVNDDGVLRRKVRDFKEDINNRGLEHMQTIPLLLMYTTCLWCNKIPIGDSKVEVYINIIEFLLSRTVQKHPEVYPSSELSHSDIPIYFKKHQCCQKFYSFLTALAKLAIHAIFNEKREHTLVFDRSVAEKYHESDDMKLSLLSGILTGSTTTTLTERRSNVSFSHKTVQELFAAIFISFQSDAQETVAKKCKNVQSILDMTMVCEFVCQMSSNKMCKLSAGFMSVLNEDEETHNYRTRTDVNWYNITLEPLYHIQKMLMSCLKKMPVTENLKLCLQDFFIDCGDIIDDKHLQRLSKLNNTNMKSLYINIFNTSNSLHDITETFSLTDLNNLQKLYYRGNRLEADISLLFFPSLQNVYLYRTTWTNYEGNLCNKLETLKNIQYLDIRLLILSHEILEIILNFISGNKTIKELTLERLSCKGYNYFDYKINFNLSKNSQLKKVRLERINLGENSLLLSRDMLNIEHVELERIKMSARSFRSIVKVLETIPQPVTVMMLGCNVEPNTEYEFVRNYIRSSQTFVVIDDQRCRFVFQRDMSITSVWCAKDLL